MGSVEEEPTTHPGVGPREGGEAVAVAPVANAPGGGKRPKKSKKAPAKEEEESANNMATVDHPYLSFLHKRIRSNKKKLEKIRGLELARSADGKVLNPQQLELVGSKPVLEKLVVEFETLRGQFIEVYLQEEAVKKAAEQKDAVEEEDKADALIDVVLETTTPEPEAAQEQPQTTETPQDAFAHVEELLKTLHVVTLHQSLGKEVPMVLDFFSKVLIGNTRPPAEVSYTENLTESLEQAKKYLATSDELFACDMSYAGLREIVNELDKAAATPPADPSEVVDVEEAPIETETSNELPQINFFTDSQLEPEELAPKEVDAPKEAAEQVEANEVITEVTKETITIEETVTLAPVAPAQVIVEPPPSALPIPIPPKSFAAVMSGGSISPSGSNRSPSPTAGDSGNDTRGKSGSQRRRGGPRPKKDNSNSTSSNGKGDGSEGAKPIKPRRPRPNRTVDEAAGDKLSSSRGGFKDKDRRARADYSFRKQTPHESAPIAPNA